MSDEETPGLGQFFEPDGGQQEESHVEQSSEQEEYEKEKETLAALRWCRENGISIKHTDGNKVEICYRLRGLGNVTTKEETLTIAVKVAIDNIRTYDNVYFAIGNLLQELIDKNKITPNHVWKITDSVTEQFNGGKFHWPPGE